MWRWWNKRRYFPPKSGTVYNLFCCYSLVLSRAIFLRYTLIWRNLPLSIFQLSLSAFFQNTNWTHRSQVSSVLIAYPPLSVDKSAHFSTIAPFQQPTLAAKYEIWIFNGTIQYFPLNATQLCSQTRTKVTFFINC